MRLTVVWCSILGPYKTNGDSRREGEQGEQEGEDEDGEAFRRLAGWWKAKARQVRQGKGLQGDAIPDANGVGYTVLSLNTFVVCSAMVIPLTPFMRSFVSFAQPVVRSVSVRPSVGQSEL